MKHLKIIGLAVMAAAALMAFAGSASAATFTSPTGTEYTGALSASLEGSALLKAGFAEDTCTESTVSGKLTTNNETEASGATESVSFTKCSLTTTTLSSKGTLKVAKGTHAVSGTGVEVTVSALGTSCVYGLGAGTSLGTATNTTVSGVDKVTLAITAKLEKISGGFACANPATWTANYIVTTPTSSFVD